jgi:hypothetical protein
MHGLTSRRLGARELWKRRHDGSQGAPLLVRLVVVINDEDLLCQRKVVARTLLPRLLPILAPLVVAALGKQLIGGILPILASTNPLITRRLVGATQRLIHALVHENLISSRNRGKQQDLGSKGKLPAFWKIRIQKYTRAPKTDRQ